MARRRRSPRSPSQPPPEEPEQEPLRDQHTQEIEEAVALATTTVTMVDGVTAVVKMMHGQLEMHRRKIFDLRGRLVHSHHNPMRPVSQVQFDQRNNLMLSLWYHEKKCGDIQELIEKLLTLSVDYSETFRGPWNPKSNEGAPPAEGARAN